MISLAETDFGQSDFGHPYWPTLANSDFGQTCPEGGASKGGAPKGGGPKPRKSVGPRRVGGPDLEKVGPRRMGGPKFRVFSSFSRHRFVLIVSLWGSSRGILVVF